MTTGMSHTNRMRTSQSAIRQRNGGFPSRRRTVRNHTSCAIHETTYKWDAIRENQNHTMRNRM